MRETDVFEVRKCETKETLLKFTSSMIQTLSMTT